VAIEVAASLTTLLLLLFAVSLFSLSPPRQARCSHFLDLDFFALSFLLLFVPEKRATLRLFLVSQEPVPAIGIPHHSPATTPHNKHIALAGHEEETSLAAKTCCFGPTVIGNTRLPETCFWDTEPFKVKGPPYLPCAVGCSGKQPHRSPLPAYQRLQAHRVHRLHPRYQIPPDLGGFSLRQNTTEGVPFPNQPRVSLPRIIYQSPVPYHLLSIHSLPIFPPLHAPHHPCVRVVLRQHLPLVRALITTSSALVVDNPAHSSSPANRLQGQARYRQTTAQPLWDPSPLIPGSLGKHSVSHLCVELLVSVSAPGSWSSSPDSHRPVPYIDPPSPPSRLFALLVWARCFSPPPHIGGLTLLRVDDDNDDDDPLSTVNSWISLGQTCF
jgi:hypothetical protein